MGQECVDCGGGATRHRRLYGPPRRSRYMEREGYAIVGYPGAGKSLAGEILSEKIDGITIETGDIVREGAEGYFGTSAEELPSDKVGEYSTMRREVDGGDYVAQDVITLLENNSRFPENPAIIVGMRDTESLELLRTFFDRFEIIWIHARFDRRLQRLIERDRQDEGDFTKEKLKIRDGRENMWGTGDLVFEADVAIHNDGTIAELEDKIEQECVIL